MADAVLERIAAARVRIVTVDGEEISDAQWLGAGLSGEDLGELRLRQATFAEGLEALRDHSREGPQHEEWRSLNG